MPNQKYSYKIEPNKPVRIASVTEISHVNELMQAILLNTDLEPHLHQVNTEIERWTPLMIATINCNTWSSEDTVKRLLDAGAEINFQCGDGWTALMIAARYSNTISTKDAVKMLIAAGANIDLQNRYGSTTALILAALDTNTFSTEHTVKMLLDAGAKINLYDHVKLTNDYSNLYLFINKLKCIYDSYHDICPIIY